MNSWSTRCVAAFLILFASAAFSPEARAETQVRVCNTCATSAQVGNEAWTWGRANVGHYGVFIVTNPAPYNLATCYQRIYQPYYGVDTIMQMAMSNCPNPGPPLAAPADVLNPAYYTSNRYYVKVGDFNSDGYQDLFVTGSSGRAVGDFILLGQMNWKFQVVPTPTTAQLQLTANAPVTSVTVMRTDFTGDGVLDFEFLNVDEAIPGAPGIIVLTQKWNGTPRAAVPRDSDFEKLVNALESILNNFDQMAALYRTTYCNIFSIMMPPPGPPFPMSALPPLRGFVEGEWDWSGNYGQYRPYISTACFSGSMTFSPEGQKLMAPLLSLQPPPDPASEARARQITEQILRRVRIQVSIGRALIIRGVAVGASAVIIADDVSVVGVLDDWALLLTGALTGYTIWSEERYQRQLAQQIGEDEGVNPQPAAVPDPYAVKSGCNPWDPTVLQSQTSAKIGRPAPKAPASWRLRDNLQKAGCGCPEGRNTNAAHHIVEKGDMSPAAVDARQCLDNAGIDVDWAGNGVCLPTNDNAPTNAFKHQSLHNDRYRTAIRDLCRNAYNLGGPDGVRSMLNDVRGLLSRGQQFW